MQLTVDQILALSPDESSRKSGRDLAQPGKWVSKGMDGKALWGECQGSGSKPYQTQIDLSQLAFKCSCPSRKFPCKHGIGLMLFCASRPGDFQSSAQPAWVADWLNKRAEKKEKKEDISIKPVDEEAKAKRVQARELKVADGVDELLKWMKDLVRKGILSIPEKGPAYFETMARRMIDAQAPGLAASLRNLGEINFYQEGWHTEFMEQLLQIYLLAKAYQHLDVQTATLQSDVKAWIGFTQNQEELREKPGLVDVWMVLAKQSSERDGITTERFWLYGTESRQYALLMQFIVRGQGVQYSLSPGMCLQAELVFYPSQTPLRALIKQQHQLEKTVKPIGYQSWKEVSDEDSTMSALNPFRFERPFIVHGLTPVYWQNLWWLQDRQKALVKISNQTTKILTLVSISGGMPMDMVVIGREETYEVVGIWLNERYTAI